MSEIENLDTMSEVIEWCERKEQEARSIYKEGTRSENSRQTDINLGKLRAYRDCKRVLKVMQAKE